MRAFMLLTGIMLCCLTVSAQQNQIITSVPNLVVSDLRLEDQNGNMTIEANETCDIAFKLKNLGGQAAKTVKIKLSLVKPQVLSLKFRKNRTLSLVKPNTEQEISFPISAGEFIPNGLAEFKIEVLEGSGFNASPVSIEVKTAQRRLENSVNQAQPIEAIVEIADSLKLGMVNLRITDPNQNNTLEAYETSHLQFRLFNNVDEPIEDIFIHLKQVAGNPSGISFQRMTPLGSFNPHDFKDFSIPIKGKRTLTDGLAKFSVFLSDASGVDSNHLITQFKTARYRPPVLQIKDAEFSSRGGKELRLNEPIKLKFHIHNNAAGIARDIDVALKLTMENIQFHQSKSSFRIDEIPGGESREITFQFIANKEFTFPNIPVVIQVTENFNDLFLDRVLVASIQIDKVFEESEPEPLAQTQEKPDNKPEKKANLVAPKAPPILELHSQIFLDDDKNNMIDYKESCNIKFIVQNVGAGPAEDVTVKINQLNSEISALSFPELINLGTLGPQQEAKVDIPIRSTGILKSDIATFRIDVLELMGFDAVPLEFEVKTLKLREPRLSIRKSHFFDESGQIRRNYPIQLRVTVQNTGPGDASNLEVQFELPLSDCWLLDEKDVFQINELKSGESSDLTLEFITTRRYSEDQIPIKMEISESYRKYGIDTVLFGDLSTETMAVTKHTVQPRIMEPRVVERAQDPQIDNRRQRQTPAETKVEEPDTERPAAELRGGGDPMKGLAYEEAIKDMQIGRYFALIIGIDKYQGVWPPLKNAVHDAKAVKEMLESNYKFDQIHYLYDDLATGENIVSELEWLIRNATTDDNVLIFYSGHGELNEDIDRGYWVPADAKTSSTFNYISNSEIQDYLKAIKSKHTLLISDACFSGDIFRGETMSIPFVRSERYYRLVHSKPSRQAITSGGIEPVMDGGKKGHSVFSFYLLKGLESNQDRFFDASQLYEDLKISVFNNSNQSPDFQHIKNTGDEGGQFIFIRK